MIQENSAMTINLDGKRTLSESEGRYYTGLGRNKFREFMNEIGATRKIGKRVVFDKKVIDSYFDSLAADNQ